MLTLNFESLQLLSNVCNTQTNHLHNITLSYFPIIFQCSSELSWQEEEKSKMHMQQQQRTYLLPRELSNKLFDCQGLSQFLIKQKKKRKITMVQLEPLNVISLDKTKSDDISWMITITDPFHLRIRIKRDVCNVITLSGN